MVAAMSRIMAWASRKRSPAPRIAVPECAADDAARGRSQRTDLLKMAARMTRRNPDIRRVMVVLNDRPAFDEIVEYRQIAEAEDVAMSIDGSGTVSFRRRYADGGVGEPAARRAHKGAGA